MTRDESVSLVRRYLDRVWTQGDLNLVDEVVAPRYHVHASGFSFVETPDMHKARVAVARSSAPDLRITVDDMIADGAKVVVRSVMSGTHSGIWLLPAGQEHEVNEQPFSVGEISIYRIEQGTLTECWQQADRITYLQQLGLLPILGIKSFWTAH